MFYPNEEEKRNRLEDIKKDLYSKFGEKINLEE
jgi:hypothetical protein